MKTEKIGNTTWITTQVGLFYEETFDIKLSTVCKRYYIAEGWVSVPDNWAPGFPSFGMQYVMIDGWIALMSRKIRWFDRCWWWLYEKFIR